MCYELKCQPTEERDVDSAFAFAPQAIECNWNEFHLLNTSVKQS